MDGYYTTHQATCQGCQAVANHVDGHGQPKGQDTLYLTDDSPDGYVPDPRMMPGV